MPSDLNSTTTSAEALRPKTATTIQEITEKLANEWKDTVYFPFMISHIKDSLEKGSSPMYFFCLNDNLTLNSIENNPDLPWDYDGLSKNPNVTFDFIKNNSENEWNWESLSRHPNITWKMITDNPQLPWKRDAFLANPNCSAEDIKAKLDDISKNAEKNNDIVFGWLAKNPNLTRDILALFLTAMGCLDRTPLFDSLIRNPGLTIQDCIDFLTDKSNLSGLFYLANNPNLTIDDVLKHPDAHWGPQLAAHPNITPEIAAAYPNHPYLAEKLLFLTNPSFSMQLALELNGLNMDDILGDCTHKAWLYFDFLSVNPNIDLNFIDKHFYLFLNEEQLCRNTFAREKQCYIDNRFASLLMVSMLDRNMTFFTSNHLAPVDLVLSNDYILSHVLPY